MKIRNLVDQPMTHDPSLVKTLGRDLYASGLDALYELVANAIEATLHWCNRQPKIEIYTGTHPCYPDSTSIWIRDNGPGLTEEIVPAFMNLGGSARVGSGKHGIGRLSTFFLCNTDPREFTVITRPMDEKASVARLLFKEDTLTLQPPTFEEISDPKMLGNLPSSSFTEFVIPGWDNAFCDEELINYLAYKLPIMGNWTVSVNGTQIPKANLDQMPIKMDAPEIPHLEGIVRLRAVVSDTPLPRGESLFLVEDSPSGRNMGCVSDLPRSIIKDLPGLSSRHLRGVILVKGLGRHADTARTGITSTFWRTKMGEQLLRVMKAFFEQMVSKELNARLGLDQESGSDITTALDNLASVFAKAYGHAELGNGEGDFEDSEAEPDKKDPRTRDRRRGDDAARSNTSGRRRRRTTRATQRAIKVEGRTYVLVPLPPLPGQPPPERPSTYSKSAGQDQIYIYQGHPDVMQILQLRSKKAMQTALRALLIQIVLEVHCEQDHGLDAFAALHRLKNSIRSS